VTAEIAALKAERDDLLSANKLLHGTIDSYEKDHAALRAFVKELADVEHHNPPVPLWISQKARRLLEEGK
jgi:hypothetical protein